MLQGQSENITVNIEKCFKEVDRFGQALSDEKKVKMYKLLENPRNKIWDKQRQGYTVDFDYFMYSFLDCYIEVKMNKKGLDDLFQASDMDDNNSMEFSEFMMLFKYIIKYIYYIFYFIYRKNLLFYSGILRSLRS